MALLLLAIGSVETLIRKDVLRSAVWRFVSPVALVLIGMLLFFHTEYGTAEAIAEAARKHAILGLVIILAGLFKAAEVHWRSKVKWFAFPWIVLLFVAALMLITYREPPGAYKTSGSDQQGITRSAFAPELLTIHFTFTQEELRCDEL